MGKVDTRSLMPTTRKSHGCSRSVLTRYMAANLQRLGIFLTWPPEEHWRVSYSQLGDLAKRIRIESQERFKSRAVFNASLEV